MKNKLLSNSKIQVVLLVLTLYFTHRLMKGLNGLRDEGIEDVLPYPGINIKEY
jgi:hypothetical protein